MNVSIVREDKVVTVDGESVNFGFNLDDSIWAIQWNGTSGHIEYNDIDVANEEIDSISQFQPILDAYNAEKARLEADQAETDRIAEEARLANGGSVDAPVLE